MVRWLRLLIAMSLVAFVVPGAGATEADDYGFPPDWGNERFARWPTVQDCRAKYDTTAVAIDAHFNAVLDAIKQPFFDDAGFDEEEWIRRAWPLHWTDLAAWTTASTQWSEATTRNGEIHAVCVGGAHGVVQDLGLVRQVVGNFTHPTDAAPQFDGFDDDMCSEWAGERLAATSGEGAEGRFAINDAIRRLEERCLELSPEAPQDVPAPTGVTTRPSDDGPAASEVVADYFALDELVRLTDPSIVDAFVAGAAFDTRILDGVLAALGCAIEGGSMPKRCGRAASAPLMLAAASERYSGQLLPPALLVATWAAGITRDDGAVAMPVTNSALPVVWALFEQDPLAGSRLVRLLLTLDLGAPPEAFAGGGR